MKFTALSIVNTVATLTSLANFVKYAAASQEQQQEPAGALRGWATASTILGGAATAAERQLLLPTCSYTHWNVCGVGKQLVDDGKTFLLNTNPPRVQRCAEYIGYCDFENQIDSATRNFVCRMYHTQVKDHCTCEECTPVITNVCEADSSLCDSAGQNAYCANLEDGGYECRCDAFYEMNSEGVCENVNECELGIHNCNGEKPVCVDLSQGFYCATAQPTMSPTGSPTSSPTTSAPTSSPTCTRGGNPDYFQPEKQLFWYHAHNAAQLSQDSYFEKGAIVTGFDYHDATVDNGVDTAIIARNGFRSNALFGPVVYLAFRGTILEGFDAVLERWGIDSGDEDVEQTRTGGNVMVGTCKIKETFYDAYNALVEDKGLLSKLDDAMNKCGCACELVITGHSQGGAIAMAAAVALQHYKPIVITFAPLQAIHEDCKNYALENNSITDLDFDSVYNMVNVDYTDYASRVDPVPYFNGFQLNDAKHFGRTVLMTKESRWNVRVYDDFSPHIEWLEARNVNAFEDIHFVSNYVEILEKIWNRVEPMNMVLNTKVTGTEGFGKGVVCTRDSMCFEGDCKETLAVNPAKKYCGGFVADQSTEEEVLDEMATFATDVITSPCFFC